MYQKANREDSAFVPRFKHPHLDNKQITGDFGPTLKRWVAIREPHSTISTNRFPVKKLRCNEPPDSAVSLPTKVQSIFQSCPRCFPTS